MSRTKNEKAKKVAAIAVEKEEPVPESVIADMTNKDEVRDVKKYNKGLETKSNW